MVNKAKSQQERARILAQEKEELIKRAVAAYDLEQAKPPGASRLSSRTICQNYEKIHLETTGRIIKLNHNTLLEQWKGRKSKLAAAQELEWLLPEEIEVVIQYIIKSASQGFPLSHRRLKIKVDRILRARLGDKFPEGGVGKRWTERFVKRHADVLKTVWSTPQESKRLKAANPNNNKAWFDLLEGTLTEYAIKTHNIYAVDEVGCQPYGAERERVIGTHQHGPQFQQRTGNRENITVLVTICADGTAPPPAIIFKGKGYQVKWGDQSNPANASIGYSKKGWTDNEIGTDWLKLFNEQTADKAEGEWRLLLVDGHTSHYSLDFLTFAREHKIIVLCFPSHTTHIYQGLDVIIFSVLKRRLSYERDEFVRKTGQDITKENFLGIYGWAHLDALTSHNVKEAFRKTGVVPFDRSVITPHMLAPSQTSSLTDSNLPAPPPTPLKLITKMLHTLSIEDDTRYNQ